MHKQAAVVTCFMQVHHYEIVNCIPTYVKSYSDKKRVAYTCKYIVIGVFLF